MMTDGGRQAMKVQGVVLCLGSNYRAEQGFDVALDKLGRLGLLRLSQVIQGADIEARSSLIYHNVCVHLQLYQDITHDSLQQQLKQIEKLCGRDEHKKTAEFDYQVALDIDILAVCINNNWQVNPKRLPFKAHERIGIQQVASFLL